MNRLLKGRIQGVILALFLLAGAAHCQGDRVAEREAEWRSYKVPAVNYVRHMVTPGAPDNRKSDHDSVRDKLLFRVPAQWKELPGLTFNGPDGSYLRVVTETVPDGVPLSQYAVSVLQNLQDLAAGPDSIVVRRTQMAGDEGREILLELPDARGVMQRRTVWMSVQGPTALLFVFVTPTARAAELEPYFKGVIQSTNVSRGGLGWFLYDSVRRDLIKEDKPERIDRVLWLAEATDSPESQARSQAAATLGPVLSESPGAMLDLLLDGRPAVRGAAIDAMTGSGSRIYDRILLRALKDLDVLVAERAARVLASRPDVQAMLREETQDWHENEALFRVWPFLDGKSRKQVVNEIFSRQNFRHPTAGNAPAPQSGSGSGPTTKPPTRPSRGGRNAGVVTVWADSTPEYNRLFTALSLLLDVPVSDQRIPLDEIAASGYDLLITPALQIGLDRRERFRIDGLLKLLSSRSEAVSRLAALNLAVSATVSDIPRIQEAAERLNPLPAPILDAKTEAKPDTKADAAAQSKKTEQNARLVSDLRATVKKIRLRDRLASAEPGAKSQLIKEGLADAEIADWTWEEYEREQSEAAEGGKGPGSPAARDNLTVNGNAVKPEQPNAGTDRPANAASVSGLGENIFPSRVTLYAAMRNPAATFKKLGDSLTDLQMDTVSDQALFVLMLSSIKARLARMLGGGQSLAANIGIDLNAPIAAARWTAEGAPRGLKVAQRKAVIMRVSDRERLERLLGLYQMHVGGFSNFTEGFSLVSRFIGLLPAVLPSVAGVVNSGPEPEKHSPGYKFEFRSTEQIRGHKVTVIERRQASPDGEVETDAIYLTYIGDEALIAPDGFSLEEALANLESGRSSLSDNAEFKRAAGRGGDVIYLSDLTTLFGASTPSAASGKDAVQIRESGALDISNTEWANSYRLSIPDSTWLKPLVAFQPQTHTAATELLPSSTVMYLLIKVDVGSIWRGLKLAIFSDRGAIKNISSAWSLDFEKEVLSELGPECGAALLGVPNLEGKPRAPWVIFFKLKTDRLAEAMKQGRLIKNSAGPSEIQHLKIGSTDVAVEIRNGFLVLGANEEALRRLEGSERLASARDFARAAAKAPSEVIAFGGYNLEAANAELKGESGDYRSEAVVRMLKSLVRAFHSQNFFITADGLGLSAHMSVSLDREGRYSVAELAAMSKDYRPTYATIEARGVRISDQQRLASLRLKIRVKPAGAIDRIADDLKTEYQSIAKSAEQELIVDVKPRRTEPSAPIKLPVADKQFTPWLGATGRIRSDDKDVIARAREIAGSDSDGWSVARKLGDWIYKNLKWRVVEPGDAAQTLATREAACLEFSELYVAMARALGLPARIVAGLAYSDGSFGGHAWVEVYAGRWIEIDPTWGTNFVDATHLRETTDDLTTYAALNLASIEVIEAPRVVADFQRDPVLLVGKLCEELPKGIDSALTVGVDLAALTDQMMGPSAWSSLADGERDQMSSAYRRLILGLSRAYRADECSTVAMRVLKVATTGDHADALVMALASYVEVPLRLRLKRMGDVWLVTDIVEIDTDFNVLTENLRPAVDRIQAKRNGGHPETSPLSTRGRIDVLLKQDTKAAMELVDRELEKEPRSAPLRHLKALCLERLNRTDEAVILWSQLTEEKPPFAAALLQLARHYEVGEKKEPKEAIDLYQRYAAAVPDDPRPDESLGNLHESEGDMVHAEAEFRACIERDRDNPARYDDLARVLALQHRYAEAVAALDEGVNHGGKDIDMFANLLAELDDPEQAEVAEGLAASQPQRMAASSRANLNLAYIRVAADRPRDALPLLKKAIELDPKSADAYDEMALAHRKLQEWSAALAAADAAVKISNEDSDAHYNRACALARLGRLNDALAALKRSIDLDVDEQLDFANEEDLKPLAKMAGFKKLLSDKQKEQDKDK